MTVRPMALILFSILSSALPASAARVQIGTITCDVSAAVGKILTAKQEVDCVYEPTSGAKEHYRGVIAKFGLEIGDIRQASLVWLVYGATSLGAGAVAGNYIGVDADAAAGVGLGANVLVGGQSRSIALQPVSLQSEQGINLAIGTEELKLLPAVK